MNGECDAAVYRRTKVLVLQELNRVPVAARKHPFQGSQLALTLTMNSSTSRFRVSACCDRSTAESRASAAMRPVSADVEVIWTMWLETSSVPCAASCALRVMSCVALRCWAVSTSMPDMIDEISDSVFE